MKLIKSIVSKEGNNSKRIIPFITQLLREYYANNTLNDLKNSACSVLDAGTKYYSIIFPFDSFITDRIEITTYPGFRYPLKIDIQGTGDRVNFVHLAYETADNICSSYSTKPNVECGSVTPLIVKIPKDVYKGFKIVLVGKDNRNTEQLCIGKFEIFGSFVKEKITCYQMRYCNRFLLNVFLLTISK